MDLSGKTTIKVRYAETDQMGIVYHSNYLIWFEVGRTELFRQLGLPYTLFEEQGLGLAVIEATCLYRKPARYDEELTITTVVEEISSRKVTFSYKIHRDQLLLAEGSTRHLFINKEGRLTDARSYPIWTEVEKVLSAQK
ncbi:acyl-CoA thioesterase [Paradesulfitobacterium ferrireducens]|uniref:acyl-CoA thioesterase n=1 Tax=Paradesulfitobacterium ferrireducens TaxID=2816476 RepID=UPI001A8DFA66|nr:thioesterase family protein [Paradesulfitobacterium ferrireducens]